MNIACIHLVLAALVVGAAPPPVDGTPAPAKRSVLVLPLSVDADAPGDVLRVAETVERGLARAVERQGTTTVVRAQEVRDRVGEIAAKQMTGCDEVSCLAELAGSLGVDRILQGRLRMRPGVWELRVSVIDRARADVTLRRDLTARSVDALFASLDTLAREVAGGTALVADDPRLAERLGTEEAGADRLRKALAAGAPDPVQAWTDEVIKANAESERLAFAEGLFIGLGGAAVLSSVPLFVLSALLQAYAVLGNSPPWAGGQLGRKDTYAFPWVLILATGLQVATFLLGIPFVSTGIVLLLVDRLDLGRIRVARDGCCRDERRIRAAALPGWGRRAAPVIAVVGGGLGMFIPLLGFLGAAAVNTFFGLLVAYKFVPIVETPGIPMNEQAYGAVYAAITILGGVSLLWLLGTAAVAAMLGAVLAVGEYSPVVDAQ